MKKKRGAWLAHSETTIYTMDQTWAIVVDQDHIEEEVQMATKCR